MVIRSTLVIHNASKQNEGVYQCRSSASPYRYTENVNLYQHWKIEETPVTDVKCNQGKQQR